MGIFSRMKDIAIADVNRVLDRIEDPISMARHYIRQFEEQIDRARGALATQLAAEQQYDLLVAQTGQLVDKRARQAELAVDRGQDDIAALALQEKLHHGKLLQTYLEQRDVIRNQTANLRREIERLQELHRELNNKLSFLMARANAAAAIRETVKAVPYGDADKISREFGRIEQKVMRWEAGAEAHLSTGRPSVNLAEWSERDEIQSELEKLKAARQA
ncbi:PspA/IM30 family protein [Cohnella hashimotonis]|uniref:PspA/IM30 family protein n=1 Tax=Cohnella hashimotonis TaxID=2826895 RepID=A0ABT6TCJ6_9BACL|nr:PspA/IM30 family protein [Cohnella hashimotonis]MDI4644546.1 PspA/IM30 family protein [Cohnella hashimotonis]